MFKASLIYVRLYQNNKKLPLSLIKTLYPLKGSIPLSLLSASGTIILSEFAYSRWNDSVYSGCLNSPKFACTVNFNSVPDWLH